MSMFLTAAVTIGVGVLALTQGGAGFEQLAASRQAIGGDARIQGLTSLVLRATVERGAGGTWEYGTTEVYVELPSRYLRQVTIARPDLTSAFGRPTVFTAPQVLGFDRDAVIYRPDASYALRNRQPVDVGRSQLDQLGSLARLEYAELMIGMLATTRGGVAAQVQPDTTRRDRFTVTVEGEVRDLLLDPTTGTPAAVGTLAFKDRRPLDGLLLPYTIERTSGRRTNGEPAWTERWKVEEIRLNVPIDPKVFRR